MILSKQLYLRRGVFKTFWLCLRHLFNAWINLFRKQFVPTQDHSRKLGLPILTLKQSGDLQCNACGLCIGYCPTRALDLTATEEGVVTDFKLDVLKCVLCGLCQDVCPVDAIRMGKETAKANHAEAQWVLDAKQLSESGVISRLA